MKNLNEAFFVDLRKNHTIYNADASFIKEEMTDHGVNDLDALSGYERRFFASLDDCNDFLDQYDIALDMIKRGCFSLRRGLPTLKYKRHYLVLTALGLKNQTYRKSLKYPNLKAGDYLNLCDQTYFVTVKIKRVYFSKEASQYCYEFDTFIKN